MVLQKKCTSCDTDLNEFTGRIRKSSGIYHSTCRACHNQLNVFQRQRYKWECIQAYGGPTCNCVGCDETRFEFLTIDHVDDNGAEHRRTFANGNGGFSFYLWLKRQKFPPGFQVLCMNCNFAKGAYGYCPHNHPSKVDTTTLVYKPRRSSEGAASHSAKLDSDKVEDVKRRIQAGETLESIAAVHDVHRSSIFRIKHGKTWKNPINVDSTENEAGKLIV